MNQLEFQSEHFRKFIRGNIGKVKQKRRAGRTPFRMCVYALYLHNWTVNLSANFQGLPEFAPTPPAR